MSDLEYSKCSACYKGIWRCKAFGVWLGWNHPAKLRKGCRKAVIAKEIESND